jgi:hypothetical protein
MKTVGPSLVILLLLFSSYGSTQQISQPQHYWVTFYVSGQQMAMKMDQFGKIIVPPKVALSKGVVGSYLRWGAVISPGASPQTINIWFQRGRYSTPREYVAVLNLRDFRVLKIERLLVDSINPFLSGFHVTQKDRNNFLTFHQSTGPLMGAGISNGQLNGSTWQISPKGEVALEAGGVSRDGLMAFFTTDVSGIRSKLYLRPLKPNGKPKDSPVLVKTSQEFVGLYGFDVSNELPDETRMVLYFHYLGGCGVISRLQLRPVNAKTGEPTGKAITLLKSYDFNPAALDESAHFVLYAIYDSLYYRAIDATGHKSGSARLVFKGVSDIGLIDIMKE